MENAEALPSTQDCLKVNDMLAALITGKHPALTKTPATATFAIPATIDSGIAKVAGIAVAIKTSDANNQDEVLTFEGSGSPVSCPYWFQVCWAVGMYQAQCTRSSACTVFNFLKINSS